MKRREFLNNTAAMGVIMAAASVSEVIARGASFANEPADFSARDDEKGNR